MHGRLGRLQDKTQSREHRGWAAADGKQQRTATGSRSARTSDSYSSIARLRASSCVSCVCSCRSTPSSSAEGRVRAGGGHGAGLVLKRMGRHECSMRTRVRSPASCCRISARRASRSLPGAKRGVQHDCPAWPAAARLYAPARPPPLPAHLCSSARRRSRGSLSRAAASAALRASPARLCCSPSWVSVGVRGARVRETQAVIATSGWGGGWRGALRTQSSALLGRDAQAKGLLPCRMQVGTQLRHLISVWRASKAVRGDERLRGVSVLRTCSARTAARTANG